MINKQIIHHLLNRMKEFNEWSQCIVLDKVRGRDMVRDRVRVRVRVREWSQCIVLDKVAQYTPYPHP